MVTSHLLPIFYVLCLISAAVFAVLIHALIKLRQSKGVDAVHFHQRLSVDILWTAIPFFILAALAIPAAIH